MARQNFVDNFNSELLPANTCNAQNSVRLRVSTCIVIAPVSNRSAHTRSRVLDAAGQLFAQRGLDAATTREIAREAQVNEVTLFRLFGTKERLQTAVLQHVLDQQAELLAAQPKTAKRGFRAEIRQIAETYSAVLAQNLSLIRMLMGEIHRPREEEAGLLRAIFQPLKAELTETLEEARRAGKLRPEVDLTIAASLLPEMILVDMLRRNAAPGIIPPYSREAHLDACLDLYFHGITAARP